MDRHNRPLVVIALVVLATVASSGLAAAGGIDAGTSADTVEEPLGDRTTALTQADCSFPVTMTDTTGTEVTIDEQPERIVVLQPSDAQIVWDIGGADRVVAMPQSNTGYLENTEDVTNVRTGNGTTSNEIVANASADVVLAANVTQPSTVDQLRSIDAPVYHFGEVSSMAETYRTINRTAQLIGNCEEGAETVSSMRERLQDVERAVADAERPTVLYSFYNYVAGNDTHLHSMIEMAGGENVAANAGISGYDTISQEVVVDASVEWIVKPSTAPVPTGEGYNATTAVEEGNVFSVNANYANQAGPRVVEVVETMARTFHPDAFDENGEPIVETPTPESTTSMDDETTGDGTAGETTGATTEATTAADTGGAETTQGNGPGFSVVLTAVALIGAFLALGVRRKGV